MICHRCGDSMPLADIVTHVRRDHPDDYDSGLEAFPVLVAC
jgi:hypothetical protein